MAGLQLIIKLLELVVAVEAMDVELIALILLDMAVVVLMIKMVVEEFVLFSITDNSLFNN